MKRTRGLLLCVWLAGCATQGPPAVPQPDTVRLTRAGFADLPGFAESDVARAAFRNSCAVLAGKADATPMLYAGTVADWRAVCAAPDAPDFFQANFTPYAIAGEGLFTGYYEPQIAASRTRHGPYQTPIYGLPPDLVRVELGSFISKLKGEHIAGKVEGGRLVPYADRAAIDAGGVSAPVLFWTDDAIAFFFLQIQGSGHVVLDDGTRTRIAYAGENGRAYLAIGRTLIAQGELKREDVSLQSIRAWLLAHPDKAKAVMQTNPSYVFFREDAARGAGGTSLTPLGSMAVDLRLHPLGAPFFVAADGPDPVHALLVAQDTGGAIRGPARADIFFGSGPDAERRAGALRAPGRLFVLLPKTLAAP
jgi:membrane-bound lytic murein transglycosylase A